MIKKKNRKKTCIINFNSFNSTFVLSNVLCIQPLSIPFCTLFFWFIEYFTPQSTSRTINDTSTKTLLLLFTRKDDTDKKEKDTKATFVLIVYGWRTSRFFSCVLLFIMLHQIKIVFWLRIWCERFFISNFLFSFNWSTLFDRILWPITF